MPEHFTHTTMEASFWCKTCRKDTMHYVHGGRRGGCQVCIARLEAEAKKPKPAAPAKQEEMF